jgi:hypothetical protein
LLHPNWPENLFGKTYFLQPEFLVIPILAFSSLLFIKRTSKEHIHINFFAGMAIIGAFLSKGVTGPFEGIFSWMFTHIPGFVMFRDPTKFYVFIAIAYSLLIPYTLDKVIHALKITNNTLRITIYVVFVIFWLSTIRAVVTGEVKGNFRPMVLTPEYIRLKDILVADNKPSRTLWIPQKEKFVYMSDTHPALTVEELYKGASLSAVTSIIRTPAFTQRVRDAAIGYVIVPTDIEKRFFLNDYIYSKTDRDNLISAIEASGLQRDTTFQEIAVFKSNSAVLNEQVPAPVKKQQYFSLIGFIISIISLIIVVLLRAMIKPKKII